MQTIPTFKVIVLGKQGVGKSSMLIRYMKGTFSDQYVVTVGVQFSSKQVLVNNGRQVRLQVWDTAGQQAFKAIVKSFYQGISGVFLAFALDDQQSLDVLKGWKQQVKQCGHKQVMFFLLGTKADLDKQVPQASIKAAMKQLQAAFYVQTSAKTGINIQELFTQAADAMYKKFMTNDSFKELGNSTKCRNSIAIVNDQDKRQKNKCCPF